jgi:vancomycin resistance protein VanW
VHRQAYAPAVVAVSRQRELARRVRRASRIAARRAAWTLPRSSFPPVGSAPGPVGPALLWHERVPIDRVDPHAEPVFEEGKRRNVALAAPAFDGVLLEPGVPFSFWRALGRPRRALGYRYGMELRGGCVVPSLGGGLCLVSNALFRMAAHLGWDVVERHGHTIEAVPSSDEPWGLDATIAWPDIDLRFAVPAGDPAASLDVRVEAGALVIRAWSEAPVERAVELRAVDDAVAGAGRRNRIERRIDQGSWATIAVNAKQLLTPADLGRSCLTCGLDGCAGRVEIR